MGSFRNAINSFVHMHQDKLPEATITAPQDDAQDDSVPSYAALRNVIDAFYEKFSQRKEVEYAARTAKRYVTWFRAFSSV